jgi:two-component system sensor histidine kinase HydH
MSERRRDFLKYGTVLFMILIVTFFHFETAIQHRYLHEIYQRIYYLPILLAAYWFGPLLGFLAATCASIFYILHIQRDWTQFPVYSFSQYIEILMYHLVALLTGFLALNDRRHRNKLEKTSQELSEAYRKLQEAFEHLKRAGRLAALGQLTAGIAHEIRNPLGSIKGSVEILENEIPPEHPKHEFVKIIKEETARLNAIVGEFLQFARPTQPRIEPTSVARLIESTLVLFKKEAQQAGVHVIQHNDATLPLVRLDPDQIRQVLLNILLNGLQAMPGGGTLEIRSCCNQDRSKAVIEVSDSGMGIEEEDIERVFDPFFTTKAQGTGLGLSISYQLVQNHNGRITVRRNEETGVTFAVELPLQSSEDHQR